jgi:CheY-like chemotaxis protein
MSGWDVAQRLRASEGLRRTTVVALTGYGRDEDRRHAAAVGCDHHLLKPVEPHALEEFLQLAGTKRSQLSAVSYQPSSLNEAAHRY